MDAKIETDHSSANGPEMDYDQLMLAAQAMASMLEQEWPGPLSDIVKIWGDGTEQEVAAVATFEVIRE